MYERINAMEKLRSRGGHLGGSLGMGKTLSLTRAMHGNLPICEVD